MRLRNNPEATTIIDNTKYVIKEASDQYFSNNNPLALEIGMGKGDFIIGMALKYPNINFIGIEKYASVLVKAIEKIEEKKLDNVLFLNEDASDLLKFFKKGTIDTIYLNFSDPWPKKRHIKRRLSYSRFLALYEELLIKDGYLKQKTDNYHLFEYSLMCYNNYGTVFEFISLNLHESKLNKDNVMSEYERKFSGLGQPIFSAHIRFKERKGVK